MGERTTAQSIAAERWQHLKAQVRYWRSWKYTPSSHPRAYAAWVAEMRNAWVAYHVGARWMRPESDIPFGFASAQEWQASELARLRAEVERLRGELRRAACNVRAWGRQSMMSNPHSASLAKLADRLNALAREDGAGND